MSPTKYAEKINAISIPTSFARRQVAMFMKTPFTPAIRLALLSGLEALNYEQVGLHKKNTFLASIGEIEEESGSPAKTIKTILGHFRSHGILEVLSYIPDYARKGDKRFYHLLDPPLDRPLTPAEEFRASEFRRGEAADLTKEIRAALDEGDNWKVHTLNDNELFGRAVSGQDWAHEAYQAIEIAATELQAQADDHARTMSLTMSDCSPLPTK